MYSSVNLSFKTFEASMGYLWNYDKKCSIEKGYCNEWYNDMNDKWTLKIKRSYISATFYVKLYETSGARKHGTLISIMFYNK